MVHPILKQTSLLLALFLTGRMATAQIGRSAALDSLVKLHLVTPEEKSRMESRYAEYGKMIGRDTAGMPQRDYSRRDELLSLLVEVKAYSTPGTMSALTFVAAPASSRALPASEIHAELDSFTWALDRANLLSTYTREDLLKRIGQDEFGWPVQIANAACAAANEEYFLRPEKLGRFVDGLHSQKVISDDNYKLLMDKSARGELHRYSELPPYLDYCITIPLKELPADHTAFLHALYARTAKTFPGLRYDTISFKVVKDMAESEPGFQTYNLITTIKRGKKTFSSSGFYDADYKDRKTPAMLLPENFHAIFNKVLADLSSPYRLHTFAYDHNIIGVIALTEKQFGKFNWTYDGAISSYIQVSYEKYTQGMTLQRIRSAVKTYDSLGLFSHLSRAEKDSGMTMVNISEIHYYSDILKCFPRIVLDIDAKYGIDSAQYARITLEAASISRGRFRPDKIIDGYTYETPQFTYGFTIDGKNYTANLHQEGNYLDPDFWPLIEKAINENDTVGAFHQIYPTDGYTEVYLTNRQFAFLQKHHLLEFTDPDQALP